MSAVTILMLECPMLLAQDQAGRVALVLKVQLGREGLLATMESQVSHSKLIMTKNFRQRWYSRKQRIHWQKREIPTSPTLE